MEVKESKKRVRKSKIGVQNDSFEMDDTSAKVKENVR